MKRNILVVDDSALMRRVICDIINSDDRFQAVDSCCDGLEAYKKMKTTSYDAVILDVNMPKMNGLELLYRLQKEHIKANVIMVSTLTTKDAEVTIIAMERGAIDFVTKPSNIIEAKGLQFRTKILSILEEVFRTRVFLRNLKNNLIPKVQEKPVQEKRPCACGNNKLIALACSTGGPKALQSVIPYLPKKLDAPMVLVQHMPAGFTKSMADRLNAISEIHVKEAEDGEPLKKGVVYIAPGGKHIEVKKNADGSHNVVYNDIPAIGGLKPCADITFDSLSDTGYDEIICVVLTGMGADGTKGIKSLSKCKSIHVIAQNAETCVVYGMPKSIVESGLTDEVVPLNNIAKTIIKNVGVK